MTTLLDPTGTQMASHTAEANGATGTATTPAHRLRATMAACRLRWTWFGTQKSLTRDQKELAAAAFDAESPYLSATKRLIDTKHSAFRAVTAIRTKATDYWRGLTLPFPEPGLRLIPQAKVAEFDRTLSDYRVELIDAVAELDRNFGELKRAAAGRLGSLFNSNDYPETLTGLFEVQWDYPNVEPPDYLMQLSPALYEAERARVAARFEEAVHLAEQAFAEEFARLVSHLTERLSGTDADGTPKVFRDSVIGNLREFFDRFRSLNVRSNAELDALVEQAQRAVRGVEAQELRDWSGLRQHVASELSQVRSSLDDLLVDRPRRRILRSTPTPAPAPGES
ncbi:hypothetical protein BH23PLA1_BH23PLA1_30070 [soil metagenome]